jgi:hypothetical protein
MMQLPGSGTMETADEDPQARLATLGTELAARSYRAHLLAPRGKRPYVDVSDPQAGTQGKSAYASHGFPWRARAERIAQLSPRTGHAFTSRGLACPSAG